MVTENVYAAPTSKTDMPAREVPEDILKKIKNGWIAGIVSGVLTLAVTLYAIYGQPLPDISIWNLADVVLIFGLAFGMYKKSRICAVLMLVYFVWSKIEQMTGPNPSKGIILAIIFVVFYWQAVVGTFKYHAFLKENA